MSSMHHIDLGRREFCKGGLSAIGLTAFGKGLAAPAPGRWGSRTGTRSLVLLQLTGGNDGLSTVVPFADDSYARARSSTRLTAKDVLPLDDYRGLHNGLRRLHRRYQSGQVAIVEGVGYERMVRSHFRALEVWHTGRRAGRDRSEGWIGLLAEAAWREESHPNLIVHLGPNPPYSVYSTAHPAAALQSPSVYKWFGDRQSEQAYAGSGRALEEVAEGSEERSGVAGRDQALTRLRGVLDGARSSSHAIRRAAAEYRERVEYPSNRLGASLRDVAALINGKLGTRVFSLQMGGFDTHAAQRASHDSLMRTLDSALAAFLDDLSKTEAGEDTLVLVFSEFGRRVQENASRGTDHGKAGPMLLFGPAVKGGLYGAHPSLTELDDGDLSSTTDFRSVYGALIEGWAGVQHEEVLGKRYPLLPLLR